jgi:uncharacterized membrane-anchored protein
MSGHALRIALIGAFLLVAGAALLVVRGHEYTLARGQVVLAELAPVDPRSLMQGDYMALQFAIDEALRRHAADPASGVTPRYAYLTLDEARRAHLAGVGEQLPPPGSGQLAMRLRSRGGRWSIGPNAFFFKEGTARDFETAQWGEFRVDADGKGLLTHLRDDDLVRLGENLR